MNYIILVILLIIGGLDVFLSATGQRTISQAYQMIFPTFIDIIIFTTGLVALCVWHHFRPELDFSLAVVMAGFWGHVTFPNKERYGL